MELKLDWEKVHGYNMFYVIYGWLGGSSKADATNAQTEVRDSNTLNENRNK